MVGGMLCAALHTNPGLRMAAPRPEEGGEDCGGADVGRMGKEWLMECVGSGQLLLQQTSTSVVERAVVAAWNRPVEWRAADRSSG